MLSLHFCSKNDSDGVEKPVTLKVPQTFQDHDLTHNFKCHHGIWTHFKGECG